jgi:hypothetical protein
MKNFVRFYVLLVALLIISPVIFGQISTELNGFNKIEIFGKINVRLEKSTADSLFIRTDGFDINQVNYLIEDSILKIKLLSEFPPSIKVDVTINFQQINELKVGGGAKVYNRGVVESEHFALSANSGCELDLFVKIDSANVDVTKGAFVRLTGENRYMNLKTTTGGDFRSTKMANSIMNVKQSGGTAEVSCTDELVAKVSFGASLKFVEKPKKLVKKEKFGGSVGRLEDF